MTMSDTDPVAFLKAQLDEEERLANAAIHAGLGVDIGPDGKVVSAYPAVQDHFATWNPGRVLREVEAKRAIIGRYETAAGGLESLLSFIRGQDDGYRQACMDAIRDLAAVSGYRSNGE